MKKDDLLKLNIQFFAEESEETEVDEEESADVEETKTFTKSEVDSQISKAVDSALKNREKKHQEELDKAIQDAIAENERLSKLSEKERKDEELTKREQEIADRLAEIERKELKADAVSDLTDKGLPVEFADFLLSDNAENTLTNINAFKEAFDTAVNAQVKEKLRQDTPLAGTGGIKQKQNSIADIANEKRLI